MILYRYPIRLKGLKTLSIFTPATFGIWRMKELLMPSRIEPQL
jgi:hypothetical protein